jgi:hypothetical protein
MFPQPAGSEFLPFFADFFFLHHHHHHHHAGAGATTGIFFPGHTHAPSDHLSRDRIFPHDVLVVVVVFLIFCRVFFKFLFFSSLSAMPWKNSYSRFFSFFANKLIL